ncbi:MAG: AAA family ATPase [Polyangiales bacterium]
MKIRRLELQGFKSFVDRTVLSFDHDVTAVVGPNGCGKSNTVDAIRWCMGEQSAKHLRGRSMEDVIFNGSDSRPPHAFAEVTLVFDNRDGLAPPEYAAYAEIAVTRRLTRDGASDYSINRTPVRLMDVTNLFLGTGAGTKAYSIVEQGRVGLIVTSKPEDRRGLLEEAAGITRFKARRKLSERRLELTKQNLLRVNDLLVEIEKGLVSLKRQAQRAERYKELRAEQRELDLWIASARYLELAATGKRTRASLLSEEAALEGVAAALARVDAEAEGARRALFEAEVALEAAQGAAFAADNEVRRLEAELQRVRDQIENGRKRKADAERELTEITRSGEMLEGERASLKKELDAVATQEAEELERLSIAEERLSEVRDLLFAIEAGLKEHREAAVKAERELATAEATRAGVARRLREAEERGARVRERRARSSAGPRSSPARATARRRSSTA